MFSMATIGQSSSTSANKKKSFSIHLIEGYRYEEYGGFNNNEYSKPGIEGQLTFHINSQWGLQLKTYWIKWENNRETYIPLLIGPEFSIPVSNGLHIVVYSNAGPSLTIGNDYAGVFASAETGIQISSRSRKGIIIGFSWGKNVVFHPSEFAILKGTIGWRF